MEPLLGEAPLFPLPNGSLLPGELLPLHVFEPRYRRMMEAVRRGDRLLVICTLLPGWELEYTGRPPIADVGGLGRLVRDRVNPDGTSDIVLHGVARGLIRGELGGRPYRRARVLVRPEADGHPALSFRLRRRLLQGLASRLRTPRFHFDVTAPFQAGALADRIASALELQPETRVQVLQAIEPERRVEVLLDILGERAHRQKLRTIIPSLSGFSLELAPHRKDPS